MINTDGAEVVAKVDDHHPVIYVQVYDGFGNHLQIRIDQNFKGAVITKRDSLDTVIIQPKSGNQISII